MQDSSILTYKTLVENQVSLTKNFGKKKGPHLNGDKKNLSSLWTS
jgi:hypothetical protein